MKKRDTEDTFQDRAEEAKRRNLVLKVSDLKQKESAKDITRRSSKNLDLKIPLKSKASNVGTGSPSS